MKDSTANRLSLIMAELGLKQIDVLNRCKPFCEKYGVRLNKNDLSQYVSGKVSPRQDKLSVLSMALNVNEVWLMGYDVSKERNSALVSDADHQQACDLMERCYGKDAYRMVRAFLDLDSEDRLIVYGEILGMLKAPKYQAAIEKKQA